jgi:hypothetical protein
MPKKRTPQARYQAALREVKRRTGATHDEAKQAYRIARSADARAKFPTYYKALKRRDVLFLQHRAERDLEKPERPQYKLVEKPRVPGAQIPLFKGEEFAFDDVERLHKERIGEQLMPLGGKPVTLLVTLEAFKDGESVGLKTIRRENVSTADRDFWYAYYDAVREGLEDFYAEGVGGDFSYSIVTHDIAILE